MALSFHRPVTKLLAFLHLEAAFTNSPTVSASYQRAKRLVGLTCSRKTFYRALDELEAAGVLTKMHVNGRVIEVTLNDFHTRAGSKSK
jgi:Fe2+ or Zn2+ uptake regulation protein